MAWGCLYRPSGTVYMLPSWNPGNVGKFLLDPTFLLWAIYFVVITISGIRQGSDTHTVQGITFIIIGQTHLDFGNRVCTCVMKHWNAFRTFLNWLIEFETRFAWDRYSKFRVRLFSHILICDLWAFGHNLLHSKLVMVKQLIKSIWAIMCDVRQRGHVSDNVRCKMHQMRVHVKTNISFAFKTQMENPCANKTRLKTRNAGCVLRFKRKRKIVQAKIYEDKRDLYCIHVQWYNRHIYKSPSYSPAKTI